MLRGAVFSWTQCSLLVGFQGKTVLICKFGLYDCCMYRGIVSKQQLDLGQQPIYW